MIMSALYHFKATKSTPLFKFFHFKYNRPMTHEIIENFSLKEIAVSGQCFRMKQLDRAPEAIAAETAPDDGVDYFEIIAADKKLHAAQCGSRFFFDCSESEFDAFWRGYFDLDTDYGKIIESIDTQDDYLKNAAACCPGIRILRQDPWEMLITFIISQQNNIPRIKKCVEAICEKYGEDRGGYHAFPPAEALAALAPDGLMELGLGYRSKYIVAAAREVVSGGLEPGELIKLDYDSARARLLQVYGIGKKVADCVCLFGLHHVEAFPIDTHIAQVLAAHYPQGFPFEKYAGYAGILQQYMFYYDLHG